MGTAIAPSDKGKAFMPVGNASTLLWLQTFILVGLLAVLYVRVLVDMANDWWTEPSLSQGMLIPPLALYIAWARRELTLAQPAVPQNRGLWLIALSCMVFLLGKLSAEFFLPRISFVMLIAGLVWTFWGYARLRT